MSIGTFGSIIDTLEVYENYGNMPQPIRVGANMYAVVYNGSGDDGFIKTFGVSDAGAIDNALTDTLEFETTYCMEPEIIHISGEVYAIVYTGPDGDGWIKTVTIGAGGAIADAVIDSLEFDTYNCIRPSIVHVDGTIYAVAYLEYRTLADSKRLLLLDATAGVTAADIGKVVAGVTTGDTGTLADYETDLNLLWVTPDAVGDKFDDSDEEITVDGVTAGNMILTSQTACWRGVIKTIDIAVDGAITDTVVDTGYYETKYNGEYPHIVRVAEDVYAVTYSNGVPSTSGGSGVGVVKTIAISNAGVVGSAIDSTTFDTIISFQRIVLVGNNIYAIGYKWRTESGAAEDVSKIKIVTITISPAGAVGAIIDTEDVATLVQGVGNVVHLDVASLFAHKVMIAYPDTGGSTLKTYDIDVDGLISLVDSLTYDAVGLAHYPRLIRIEETDIYMIVYMDSGNDGMATTYGVGVGVAYPSDALSRVSGLVHRWSPGYYTLEVFLGDVRTLWDAPPITKKAKSVEPEEEVVTEKDILRGLPELPRPPRPPEPYVDIEGRRPAGPPEEIETRRATIIPGITGPRVEAPPYVPFETELTDIQLSRLLRSRRLERKQAEETTAPFKAVVSWFRSILPW